MDTYTYENGNRRVKTAPDGFSRTENPRVGGSIPPLATTNSLNINNILIEQFQEARRVCQECAMDLRMSRPLREVVRAQVCVAPHHSLRFPTAELL